MNFPWQKMGLEEFADFERRLDVHVVQSKDHHWRRVRPFFFRPLLPFEELCSDSVRGPALAAVGGYQHAVPSGYPSNSTLNLLVFDETADYCLDRLDHNRKRQVKLATKQFEIKLMSDIGEFTQTAYPVYLSFYRRTKYAYKSDRRDPIRFANWAETLFQTPRNVILGAYREDVLGAVSVSQWVGDTVLYSTFFCDDASLVLNVSDLMLHWVRAAVATRPEVKQIFVGMQQSDQGVNKYYLYRGCSLVRKPATLQLSPLAQRVLTQWAPKQYARLLGDITLPQMAAKLRAAPLVLYSLGYVALSAAIT